MLVYLAIMVRALRSNTRRDYKKMEAGDSEAEEAENDTYEETEEERVDVVKDSDLESSPDEAEILALEERLKEATLKKERLEKKEKLKRLKQELAQVEEQVTKKKKKGKNQVTIKSLRAMADVEKEVDDLMSKNLDFGESSKKKRGRGKRSNIKRYISSSSESCSDDSSGESSDASASDSSCTSCSDSSSYMKKSSKRSSRDRKKSSEKSGKKVNRRSGKNKKISSSVKYPQQWPQSHLSLHFVNSGKKYEKLTIAEFCAGYATIMESVENKKVLKHRIVHLKDLMYLATKYRWDCVLNFHAACLLEIERGNMQWGDSFQSLQLTTLAGGFLPVSGAGHQRQQSSRGYDGPLVWCKKFQRGVCTEDTDHMGDFNGEQRYMRHICAKCWSLHKKKSPHSEDSEDCPSKEV